MEKKHGFGFGFFSALTCRPRRRSRSEGQPRPRPRRRSRSESPPCSAPGLAGLPSRLWRRAAKDDGLLFPNTGITPLSPLIEGPDGGGDGGRRRGRRRRAAAAAAAAGGGGDTHMLLTVMATPLGIGGVGMADAFRRLSVKDFCKIVKETSSAKYILQQYIGVTGGLKLLSSIWNSYATGKVKMAVLDFETSRKASRNCHASVDADCGAFVLWQMSPNLWHVELAVGETKASAGCNGELVWHHTPWFGPHLAQGPVRPIRRALQGLDPLTTANMFSNAQCVGEQIVNGEECFVLKVCADPESLRARSEDGVQITRHKMFGHFSVKTGLLIHMVDSCMTKVESNSSSDVVYWETTISSFLDDYRPVDGVMIVHSGRSVFTLYMFRDEAMGVSRMRMEELWTIDEVAFNVRGLSVDFFIPPAELR